MSELPYNKQAEALGMDPIAWDRELKADLVAQLCCAWEEWAEQHREADDSNTAVMKASKSVIFDENHIVVVGKHGKISHFKFTLERIS